MSTLEMVEDHPVGDVEECLVRAFATLDPGLLAETLDPLVGARRGVALLLRSAIAPQLRVDIAASGEEGPEKCDPLVLRSRRARCAHNRKPVTRALGFLQCALQLRQPVLDRGTLGLQFVQPSLLLRNLSSKAVLR